MALLCVSFCASPLYKNARAAMTSPTMNAIKLYAWLYMAFISFISYVGDKKFLRFLLETFLALQVVLRFPFGHFQSRVTPGCTGENMSL